MLMRALGSRAAGLITGGLILATTMAFLFKLLSTATFIVIMIVFIVVFAAQVWTTERQFRAAARGDEDEADQ